MRGNRLAEWLRPLLLNFAVFAVGSFGSADCFGRSGEFGGHHAPVLNAQNPVDTSDSPDIGFTCVEPGGNVLGCTNLPSSCSQWWPGCTSKSTIGTKSIPASCKSASFRLIQYAIGGTPVSSSLDKSDLDAANASQIQITFQNANAGSASAAGPSPGNTFAPGGSANLANQDSSSAFQATANGASSSAALANHGQVGASAIGGAGLSALGRSESAPREKPDASSPTAASYSDPALAYAVTSGSREALVQNLKTHPEALEQLRARIREAASGSAATEPQQQEKIEYFKKAIAEADARLHGKSLDALTPLGEREAFSMNGEDSEREIRRLTGSMSSASDDELTQTPLFPRVHQALLRQAAKGNLKAAPPKRLLSAGN